MPTNNLINDHYTEAEKTQVQVLFRQIRDIIKPRTRNLSPDERRQFGSIHEQTKLLVQKGLDYHRNQPELDSPDVDWVEQEADYSDRHFLESIIISSTELGQIADNTRILHDYDAYKNELVDYAYTQYKAEKSSEPGWETKYNDLKQFMPNTGGGGNGGDTPTP